MDRVCAFFGHRDVWTDVSAALKEQIRIAITQHQAVRFWCGGYGRFDLQVAAAVKEVQKEYPHIRLELVLAYIPSPGSAIPPIYDDSFYPNGLESVPRRFAIHQRNRWMVQHCHMLICHIDRTFGGAYNAYQLGKHMGKLMINIGSLHDESAG